MQCHTIPLAGIIGLAISLSPFTSPVVAIEALSEFETDLTTRSMTKGDPPDFSEDGKSGNTASGGSRGSCSGRDIPLTVLMPDANFGRATVEQPTLWFYVPYASEEIAFGLFSLQTDSDVDVGDPILVALPEMTSGFVSLTLPDSLALTELDTDYQWYFELYCDGDRSSVYVNGWIQRVEPTSELAAQLADEEIPSDIAYTNETIWFDAIAALSALRAEDPNNPELLERWNTLLTATGVSLGHLPTEPFMGEILIEPEE